jgi:hypothetical protein
MLFAGVVLFTLIAVAIRSRLPLRTAPDPGRLGWMSEQWLAEYRASHAQ